MPLSIIIKLVEYFNSQNISFCHFKSNEHLTSAVNGLTDLDILFDIEQQHKVDIILQKAGFIRAKAVWFCRYPFVEDYLAIDPDSGTLVHVHVHFRLIVGERRVKSYIIPIEELVLSTRQLDSIHNIYVSSPSVELFLLFIRYAIKSNRSNFLLGIKLTESSDAVREFRWLKERVNLSHLESLSNAIIGNKSINDITTLYKNGLSKKNLKSLYKNSRHFFRISRRYSKIKSLYLFFVRNLFHVIQNKINRKIKLLNIPGHRTTRGDGIIIALLGSDGSGKSTQIELIKKKLIAKIDTITIYMGSGKGKSSLLRLPMVLLINLKIKILLKQGKRKSEKYLDKKNIKKINNGVIIRFSKLLWALTLALERKKKLNKALRARKRGMIIICDRYPQTSINNYNDGPLLSKYIEGKNKLLINLAKWERKQYELAHKISPDLVIKFVGQPEVLSKRRPEVDLDTLIEKQEGIKRIKFNKDTHVEIIDSSLSIDEVTYRCMKAIGEVLYTHCK